MNEMISTVVSDFTSPPTGRDNALARGGSRKKKMHSTATSNTRTREAAGACLQTRRIKHCNNNPRRVIRPNVLRQERVDRARQHQELTSRKRKCGTPLHGMTRRWVREWVRVAERQIEKATIITRDSADRPLEVVMPGLWYIYISGGSHGDRRGGCELPIIITTNRGRVNTASPLVCSALLFLPKGAGKKPKSPLLSGYAIPVPSF